MRLAVVVLLAACGSAPPAPDAALPSTFTYHFRVGMEDPGRNLGLVVLIDGVATTDISATYDASQMGTVLRHHVELRYQDTVLATLDGRDVLTCTPFGGSLISYDDGNSELDSGDLRFGATDVDCTDGAFASDSFGNPNCNCGSDQRCTPRITLASPRFTRMSCAPIGPKHDGEACSFTQDPGGAYDDCGANLMCFQGHLSSDVQRHPDRPRARAEYAYDVNICD